MAMRLLSPSAPPPLFPNPGPKAPASVSAPSCSYFSVRLRRARAPSAAAGAGAAAAGGSDRDGGGRFEGEAVSGAFDRRLAEIARKVPLFEPAADGELAAAAGERPLPINLELWLYRVKVHTRKFEFAEAEKLLDKCISFWPEDGRPYVALGKLYCKQSRYDKARAVYERGCQATQGENPYIWQCWAVLESKSGNIRRARELFDASTVADAKHIAGWHGWAILEIKQGNIKKARNLLGKALKYCGGNEYIYQTLALLEAKAERFEQARTLFEQATQSNPKSCASWLAWAQVEMRAGNNTMARKLFEAWGWMEWKEGNTRTARALYQRALSVNSTNECAARCLQAWGVLEQRAGNFTAARRLLRSSLSINSQSEVTWMTWAALEEEQGDPVRAEEIRNLYFQQRTEVVDDASWVMGFLDIIDPALDSVKKLLNLDQPSGLTRQNDVKSTARSSAAGESSETSAAVASDFSGLMSNDGGNNGSEATGTPTSDFDLDGFIKKRLALDPAELDAVLEGSDPRGVVSQRRKQRLPRKPLPLLPIP